jgi:hypothetical protein
MNDQADDLLRLRHMREAAGEVIVFTSAAKQSDLVSDLKFTRSQTSFPRIVNQQRL